MSENQDFVPGEDHEDETRQARQEAEEPALPGLGRAVRADAASADATGSQDAADEGQDAAAEDLSELDKALLKLAEVEEQLARRNADLYNLQQEYSNYVKRSKAEGRTQHELGVTKVLDALLSVLDDAALARQHGDLIGPAGAIVDKLEQTLETNFQLVRYGAQGDDFDPEIHDALMNQTSADVTSQQVAQLIQPGYRQGEKVVRPARVGVVSPE